MKTMVQFGAGNIGRSFIGRLFAEAGYEVVFIDVDRRLVSLLNERKSYPVVVKANGEADKTRLVEGFRAVDGNDAAAVRQALVSADYVATSVGQRALQAVMPLIASAVELRWASRHAAMDIIIAENIRSGAEFFRAELAKHLPAGLRPASERRSRGDQHWQDGPHHATRSPGPVTPCNCSRSPTIP